MMNVIENKNIEDLFVDGVIIATQKMLISDDEEPQKVGDVKRVSYGNWQSDRQRLVENEPENIVNAVMAIWGDTPTVVEPTIEVQEERSTLETDSIEA